MPDPTLCSRCGIRAGTHYICFGGTGKSLDLCDECLPLESPSTAGFIEEARNARCEYCGGSPCGGGTDTFGSIFGSPRKNRWRCISCLTEYSAWILKAFEGLSKDLSAPMQMEEIKRINEEVDAHMKAFVCQRDN